MLFLWVLSQINYLNIKTKKGDEVTLEMCYAVRSYSCTSALHLGFLEGRAEYIQWGFRVAGVVPTV